MGPTAPQAPQPARPDARRLVRAALLLGIALEALAVLKLLPAGAFVPLGLVLLAVLALLLWQPEATLAVAAALGAVVLARRRRG